MTCPLGVALSMRRTHREASMSARLVLSDGTIFRGQAVGASGTVTGEAVFNTGMTGYQEVLSDPSYRGQLVTMTYPEIGNYGIVDADMESGGVHLSGFIMKRYKSSLRATESLPAFWLIKSLA